MAHRRIRTWGITAALILSASVLAWAANTKLSSLTAGSAIADADLLYDVQSAGSGGVKVTFTQVWTWIQTHTLPVGSGGTGATTLTTHGVVVGEGTSAVAVTSAGTSGQVLTSNGASADPTFQAAPSGSGNDPRYTATSTPWYIPSGWGTAAAAGAAPVVGTTYLFPGYFAVKATISNLGFRVTTVGTSNCQVAVYNMSASNRPGTLAGATGNIVNTSAASVSGAISGGNIQLAQGWYWWAISCNDTTVRYTAIANTSNTTLGIGMLDGSTTLANVMNGASQLTGISAPQSFGTWGDLTSATFTELTTQLPALVAFQIATVP